MNENVSRDLLDAYKRLHRFDTDYRAAKALGVQRNLLSMWRSGRQRMSEDRALILAEELGLQPFGVIARLRAEKTAGTPFEARWRRYCARVSVAVIAALAVTGTDAQAKTLSEIAYAKHISPAIHYAHLTVLKALRNFLRSRPLGPPRLVAPFVERFASFRLRCLTA
jgi:hypothetical protein